MYVSIVGYLTLGGKNMADVDMVFLVDATTGKICPHSKLPVELFQGFVFEYEDTLLLCSKSTNEDKQNLQCYIWSSLTGWEVFETPENNGIKSFMWGVQVPDVGIWFLDFRNSLILNTTGQWEGGFQWTNARERHCGCTISDTKVANIGGSRSGVGQTIDTYDFETNTEELNVTLMLFDRKQFSCTLLKKGPSGNPTVAIRKL